MTVNLEVKGNVARLLATENLIVENKQVETASFNVDTRVLTLPMWEKSCDEVYDLLVSHEVAHALFTPNKDWDFSIPQQFLNIVEDVRVEKLMKRKFAGLSKTFYQGYKQFWIEDFFEIEGKDLGKMNLADRINIHFKIGSFVDVPFTDEEKEILKVVESAETFDEVQEAASTLYKFCKEQQNKEKMEMPVPSDTNKSDTSSTPIENNHPESGDSEDSNEDEKSIDNSDIQNSTGESHQQLDQEEPEVETDTASTSNIKNLVDMNSAPSRYLEFPTLNLDKVINTNKEIHDYINDIWKPHTEEDFKMSDEMYKQFKKDANKEVNYLVKEFQMRKSASAYSRAFVSRTGVLDCSKLHTYKYNEDLFKKVTTLKDGKNHGLIFILDWSGSMADCLEDTVKQLYNLLWFCKKVGIPFKVYAFTYQYKFPEREYDEQGFAIQDLPYERKKGTLHVNEDFSLMEFFSSDVNQKEFERQLKTIWRVVQSMKFYMCRFETPPRLGLSGTPLNESIVALRQLIPLLQKQWGVEKLQCIMMTDGESNHLIADRWLEPQDRIGQIYTEGRWSTRRLNCTSDFLRNRKTGLTYKVPMKWWSFTECLLKSLKSEFPQVNFIGIRLLDGREANSFIRRHYEFDAEGWMRVTREWKKDKSFTIDCAGYDSYFGISTQSLSNNSIFDVDEGASKAKIKSAFIKSLKTKKLNKKVLNEFVELIA